MQKEIKIIHKPTEDEPYVIISKPADLPSAPLNATETENALCKAAVFFPEIKKVAGKKSIEYGLLHRIDTDTSGLLMIATSQFFYDYMIKEQTEGRFLKTYRAVCNIDNKNSEELGGFPVSNMNTDLVKKLKKVTVNSYFRNFGEGLKSVRPVTDDSGKAALKKLGNKKNYSTEIFLLKFDEQENTAEFQCSISAGYRHQVRCHLAWCGFPIKGDRLYNRNCGSGQLEFQATALKFTDPFTGKLTEYFLQNQ